jgi:hypothetical protein
MLYIDTYLDSLPEDIEEINVAFKNITYLDVTRFKKLNVLFCNYNDLTSLKLNENLKKLYCNNNKLTSLQLNEKLETVHCNNNVLTSLILNEKLKKLNCSNNQLTTLQLNKNLQELYCCNNQFTSLHLNENLKIIYCERNKLTSLDLNKNLKTIYYSDNPIYDIINSNDIQIINKKLRVLKQFQFLYYCIKFKRIFRDLLWVKIREPKIREKYSYNYLVVNLHEETDLDELLENW